MKIIKHGKKPEPKILRFECPKCGCVFEAEDNECGTLECGNLRGEPLTTLYEIDCPECGEVVTTDD